MCVLKPLCDYYPVGRDFKCRDCGFLLSSKLSELQSRAKYTASYIDQVRKDFELNGDLTGDPLFDFRNDLLGIGRALERVEKLMTEPQGTPHD